MLYLQQKKNKEEEEEEEERARLSFNVIVNSDPHMVTMSCSGNLVWDVNKRLIGYNEPNTIRTNYLGKSLFDADGDVGEIGRREKNPQHVLF